MNVPLDINEIENPNDDEIDDALIFRNDKNEDNIDGELIIDNDYHNKGADTNFEVIEVDENINQNQDVEPVGVRRPRPRRRPICRYIDAPEYQTSGLRTTVALKHFWLVCMEHLMIGFML